MLIMPRERGDSLPVFCSKLAVPPARDYPEKNERAKTS